MRRRHAARQLHAQVHRRRQRGVEEIVQARRAEHVGDLVRIADRRGDAVREHAAVELERRDQRGFDMQMGVDEAGDDDLAGDVDLDARRDSRRACRRCGRRRSRRRSCVSSPLTRSNMRPPFSTRSASARPRPCCDRRGRERRRRRSSAVLLGKAAPRHLARSRQCLRLGRLSQDREGRIAPSRGQPSVVFIL